MHFTVYSAMSIIDFIFNICVTVQAVRSEYPTSGLLHLALFHTDMSG
jgi:hypothetical protein